MARIRTIKPELWTSPQVVRCSRDARLTFIGLLNFCDDNGIHPASVSRLRMEVFPEDGIGDDAVRSIVAELIRAGLVAAYLVGDEAYWCVTGWSRHQKIDRPTFRHPLPDGTAGQRMTDEIRRRICEESASAFVDVARRGDSSNSLVEVARRESSGTEWNGMESKGVNPPSQGEGCTPQTSTTGVHAGGAEQKIHRRFVAAGVSHV